MSDPVLPVIRLKPKIRPQAILRGFPWLYDNELVTDRRTRSLSPGSLAVLEDSAREPLALVAVNPASRIMARVLDRDPQARIDTAWFKSRIQRALALREKLFDAPYYRLIHAEADGLPGIVIDRFGDYAVIQPNAAWAETHLPDLSTALVEVTGLHHVIKNASGRARLLEGLDDAPDQERKIVHGCAPEAPLTVPMNNALYRADLMAGQKTGLFFDQRLNHAMAASVARDARVLDVFSHVGGFALAALAAGAKSALAVDGSAPALALAEQAAEEMGQGARFTTWRGDAFATLETLAQEAAEFDLVICDPPAFAPSKRALEGGLRAYEKVARLAAPLVAQDGCLVLCSCSHAASLEAFRKASLRGIARAGRAGTLFHTGGAGPDHPLHPHLVESGYLKALFFRL